MAKDKENIKMSIFVISIEHVRWLQWEKGKYLQVPSYMRSGISNCFSAQ